MDLNEIPKGQVKIHFIGNKIKIFCCYYDYNHWQAHVADYERVLNFAWVGYCGSANDALNRIDYPDVPHIGCINCKKAFFKREHIELIINIHALGNLKSVAYFLIKEYGYTSI